jgi:hypothetical protein
MPEGNRGKASLKVKRVHALLIRNIIGAENLKYVK